MFKRVIAFLLTFFVMLTLFAGCSAQDQAQAFDAESFVDDCRILAPASQYDAGKLKNFEIDFIRSVLIKFGKSDYYKNMTEQERETALKEICEVLKTYSYGLAKNGFAEDYTVDMKRHNVICRLKDFSDSEVMWSMPGY